MDTPDTQIKPPTKTCIVCANDIPTAAVKCTKCGSYQDFRRYFEFSNSTLALLIALISVIGLAHKNIQDLYKAIFVDPLQPNIVAHIRSIKVEKMSVVFHNNAASRITIGQGIVCRVPIYKPTFEPIDDYTFRYPSASDVTGLHMIVYEVREGATTAPSLILEGGKTTIVDYVLHQTRPEEDATFDQTLKEVKPYCFPFYVDQRGRDGVDYMQVEPVQAYYLQKELVERSRRAEPK